MGIVVFFVLAAISVGIIAYPLLPGRVPAQPAPAVTEAEIERAVRNLRRTQSVRGTHSRGGLSCPSCGKAYQEGDRFCVRCGGSLPEAEAQSEPDELVCSSCGASLHAGDQFCAKCGHLVATGEVV
jgi:predicted amidophosphoribosyltransferase